MAAADCFAVGFLAGAFFFLVVAIFFAAAVFLGGVGFAEGLTVVDLGAEAGSSCATPGAHTKSSAIADANRNIRIQMSRATTDSLL